MHVSTTSSSLISTYTKVTSSSQDSDVQKKDSSDAKKDKPQELNSEELRVVKDLTTRDTQVKAHEAAHQAAGAGMVGAASFTYQQGPDGKMYAIGGEVPISVKSGTTPEESIANARRIIAAAMAPVDPSPQDYAVASSAKMMQIKAEQQLVREKFEEMSDTKAYDNTQNDKTDSSEKDDNIDISV